MRAAIADVTRATAALHLQGISKRFGATQALDGVNLRVEAGTIHSVRPQSIRPIK